MIQSKKYTFDLQANGALRFPISGSFVRVISALGLFDIASDNTAIDNATIADGWKDKPFTFLYLKDRSGAANTVTIVVSDEEFLNAPATSTAISANKTTQVGGAVHTAPAVGVGSGQLLAANPARQWLLIQNVGTVDIWIRFGATAAVAGAPCIRIPPGGDRECDSTTSTQAIQAIAASAGASVSVVEG